MRHIELISLSGYQQGASKSGILIAIGSIAFFILAFRYRINPAPIDPWNEQVFRGVMLVYFNMMLFLIVPSLGKWLNEQEFMKEDNKKPNNSIWTEYLFLGLSAFFVLTMANALIIGEFAEIRRYGSGPIFDALTQPAQFWSNVFAGYFITLFCSTVYWQMRLFRLDR